MANNQHQFIDYVIEIIDKSKPRIENWESVNQRLREEFLRQNSETPDNVASIEQIEINKIFKFGHPTVGLKIRDKNILLSTIVWKALENDAGVELVLSKFPELTRAEVEAALRLCTVILVNLEGRLISTDREDA